MMTLTTSERSALGVFQQYLVTPGQILCFAGPILQKNKTALRRLTEKGLILEEKVQGGYSLTTAGYEAMRTGN